jgi:branched-subunit amino acid ABC-type transport system permease component
VTEFLSTLPGGLVTGAVYALLAMGLVFIYKATRVPNFSYGALAAFVAFFHYSIVNGRHVGAHLNLFFIHAGFDATVRLPFWGAVPVSLAFAAIVGYLMERFVMRPFARAPMVTNMIVTLALSGLFSALTQQWFGGNDLIVPNEQAIFPRTSALSIGGVKMSWEQLGVIGLVLAFAGALYLLFRFTETGLALRAVATDRDVASLQGVSVRRVSTIAWVFGSLAAGIAGIMLASLIVSSNPSLLILLTIWGFAAAITAGMISFPIAVGAGFSIGIVVEVLRHYVSRVDATKLVGIPETVALGAVIAILAARPRWIFKGIREEEDSGVVARASGVDLHIGRWIDPVEAYRLMRATFGQFIPPRIWNVVKRAAPILLIAIALAFPLLPLPEFWTFPLNLTLIYLLVGLSFVVIIGWLGQLSLATGAFVAIGGAGAYIGANFLHLPFPLPIVAGVLLSIPVSALIGLPALRLRGLHLAIATLLFGLVVERAVLPRFTAATVLRRPSFLASDRALYYVFLVCALAAFAFAWRLSRTRMGRAFRAIRDSETVASAYGIQPVRTKLTGFAISGAIGALGGSMLIYQLGSFQAQYGSVAFSIGWVLNAVVGGITSIAGPIIGAVVFGFLPLVAQGQVQAAHISFWPQVVASVLIIVMMAINPEGLASMARFLRTRVSAHDVEEDEDLEAIESAAKELVKV